MMVSDRERFLFQSAAGESSTAEQRSPGRLKSGDFARPAASDRPEVGGHCRLWTWVPGSLNVGPLTMRFFPMPAFCFGLALAGGPIGWALPVPVSVKPPGQTARAPEPPPKWQAMDYGPFISATIKVPLPQDNVANKGIAIKIGAQGEGTMVFDTDLMRWAGGSTGGFLSYTGVAFDGAMGPNPELQGDIGFACSVGPGWRSEEEGNSFADPRERPFGPLPAKVAHYRGLYVQGDRVILSYTVGEAAVLESPGLARLPGGAPIFTRTIQIGASAVGRSIVVLDAVPMIRATFDPRWRGALGTTGPRPMAVLKFPAAPETEVVAGLIGAPQGAEVTRGGGSRLIVHLPPLPQGATFTIALLHGTPVEMPEFTAWLAAAKAPGELAPLTHGGPARWTQPVETHGRLSTSTTPDGAYTVDTIAAPDDNPYHSWMRFGGFDFFADGHRAAICTWSGDVWIVSGIDEKLARLTWKRFASGLFQPLGLKIVNDEIFVTCRDGLIRLRDLNGDGEADFYESYNNAVIVTPAFHEFALDLQTDRQGNFYFAKAGAVSTVGEGWQSISPHNGIVARISADGQKFDVFATGVRAPNGLSMGPHDELTLSDNEGTWVPACRLDFVKEGDFLGVPDLAHRSPVPDHYGNPILWLPHNEADNSGGGQAWVTDERWGPFNGHLLHTSYGTCSLFLVMNEDVGGQHQGGVVRFPLDFTTGIMRARFNAGDGQLYVCGLKGWATTADDDGAFQRVRYTGLPVVLPSGLQVRHDHLVIAFTTPVDRAAAEEVKNFAIEQWNYRWTKAYGSPDFSVAKPNEHGRDAVAVRRSVLSRDGRLLSLEVPGLAPVMQMKIKLALKSTAGIPMNFTIYNTIARVPE
jgi:uncharacterized protein DUF6797